jgi:hypothetical protein
MRKRTLSYVDNAPDDVTTGYLVLQDDAIAPRRMVDPLARKVQEEFMEGKITKAASDDGIMFFQHKDRALLFMRQLHYSEHNVNLWEALAYGEVDDSNRKEEYHSDYDVEYAKPIRLLRSLLEEKNHPTDL